jgi:hypothetical protein
MEGDFSNLGYTPQLKHDLEWGYYIMNFIPECWQRLRLSSITQETDFVNFSHGNKDVCNTVNEVAFNLNEYTLNMVMRTMVIIAKHGWEHYKEKRLEVIGISK